MKVLVTGFEPWGAQRTNPSGEVARALGGHVLPVDFAAAGRGLRRLIRAERPDAVLLLGLAPSRTKLSLEMLALNLDHHEEKPWRRWRRAILPGKPFVLESRLPIERIRRRLLAAGLPASISHHAGTFICNHVFYLGLALTRVPCGFVHVPPFKAMSRDRQIRAVRTILAAIGGRSPAATRSARRRGPSPRS